MPTLIQGLTGNPGEVIVQHCGEEEGADSLSARLTEQGFRVMKRRIGIVLAVHLGTPILSTAWVEASPEGAG